MTDDATFDRERIATLKERAHKAHADDLGQCMAWLQYHCALQAAYDKTSLDAAIQDLRVILRAFMMQARLRNDPAECAKFAAELALLDRPNDTQVIADLVAEWRTRGLAEGLTFDLEVAAEIERSLL